MFNTKSLEHCALVVCIYNAVIVYTFTCWLLLVINLSKYETTRYNNNNNDMLNDYMTVVTVFK